VVTLAQLAATQGMGLLLLFRELLFIILVAEQGAAMRVMALLDRLEELPLQVQEQQTQERVGEVLLQLQV
jgi:hypothetical protein